MAKNLDLRKFPAIRYFGPIDLRHFLSACSEHNSVSVTLRCVSKVLTISEMLQLQVELRNEIHSSM